MWRQNVGSISFWNQQQNAALSILELITIFMEDHVWLFKLPASRKAKRDSIRTKNNTLILNTTEGLLALIVFVYVRIVS